MQEDLEVQPTRSGLESLYWTYRGTSFSSQNSDYDPVVHDLMALWPEDTLVLAQTLFAARGHGRASSNNNIIATSHSGLCFYLNTLTKISSNPQRACLVTIVPGKIEWDNHVYDIVHDQEIELTSTPKTTGYDATSMATVTNYDTLSDSSTPGLITELIVEEVLPESTSFSAIYQVSTPAYPPKQCVRCCVVNAESAQSRSERGDCCSVSIITSS
jgi:hypothetical protein